MCPVPNFWGTFQATRRPYSGVARVSGGARGQDRSTIASGTLNFRKIGASNKKFFSYYTGGPHVWDLLFCGTCGACLNTPLNACDIRLRIFGVNRYTPIILFIEWRFFVSIFSPLLVHYFALIYVRA